MGQTSSQSLPAAHDLTINTVPDPAVILREVGLRDGLQAVSRTLPTAHKLAWITAAHASGLRELEVGSFVPPRLLPQLADTAELVAFARSLPGLTTSVLVPNLKGAQRAIDAQADVMLLPLSASHAHSLANLRQTPDAVVAEIARIRDLRDAAGSVCILEVGISTAFGCTIQGVVEPDEVLRLLQAALDAGAERVGLADTVGCADPLHVGCADPLHVGCADPLHVGRLFAHARALAGDKLNCGHFHDTRGLGLANTVAAWQTGVSRFDACLGGIGGCPHAPGASGNVATEDAAYLFASMGVATGVDVDALIALRAQLAKWLDGEPLHGNIWRAGLPKTLLVKATA